MQVAEQHEMTCGTLNVQKFINIYWKGRMCVMHYNQQIRILYSLQDVLA